MVLGWWRWKENWLWHTKTCSSQFEQTSVILVKPQDLVGQKPLSKCSYLCGCIFGFLGNGCHYYCSCATHNRQRFPRESVLGGPLCHLCHPAREHLGYVSITSKLSSLPKDGRTWTKLWETFHVGTATGFSGAFLQSISHIHHCGKRTLERSWTYWRCTGPPEQTSS